MPIPNSRESIQSLVREDLAAREILGISRYGTALQADNGRDALRDAYEEAMDLTCYLRQAIEERDSDWASEPTPSRAVERTNKMLIAAIGVAIVVLVLAVGAAMALAGRPANLGGQGGMTTPAIILPSPYGSPSSNLGQVPDPGLRPSPSPQPLPVAPAR